MLLDKACFAMHCSGNNTTHHVVLVVGDTQEIPKAVPGWMLMQASSVTVDVTREEVGRLGNLSESLLFNAFESEVRKLNVTN